uniref:Uncharacterized protein n=1 Tax=Triticum urartu TaxID=4572 RepID=A0A8R7PTL2_TRIUA
MVVMLRFFCKGIYLCSGQKTCKPYNVFAIHL